MNHRLRFLPLLVGGLACVDPPVPATVYVPARDYSQSLTIEAAVDTARPIRPTEWVQLHATARAGPWRAVPRDSTDLNGCWYRRPPPVERTDAAGSVTWRVEPADNVTFNLPQPPAWERRVRFPRPGAYRLWAIGAGCPDRVGSDTLTIEVRP